MNLSFHFSGIDDWESIGRLCSTYIKEHVKLFSRVTAILHSFQQHMTNIISPYPSQHLLWFFCMFVVFVQLCLSLCNPTDCRLPCPSPTPGACSNSCPLSWWGHPAISSSVIPFFSCLQSFPASHLLAVQWTLKSLLQLHSSKASIVQHSAFFTVQLSHPYMTTGKIIALTRWIFVGKYCP